MDQSGKHKGRDDESFGTLTFSTTSTANLRTTSLVRLEAMPTFRHAVESTPKSYQSLSKLQQARSRLQCGYLR